MRRREETERMSGMAMAVLEAIRVNLAGGSTADVVRPIYTPEEWKVIEETMERAKAREARMKQLETLRRIAKRWQTTRQ